MNDLAANTLWHRTLSPQKGESETSIDSLARGRLREALLRMRERAAQIVAEIPRDLPSFTVHDVTHLDALWEMAEIISGATSTLTPTEAFVFGGAVLLHDAAMTLSAYAGREATLRQDIGWKDHVAGRLRAMLGRRPTEAELSNPPEMIARLATEDTLRARHAAQAERVATQSWRLGGGELAFVIQDDDLRANYGALIGRIAHSHWWSVERVAREFATRMGAPSWAPNTWTLDALKVACLLRVSDAAHLDARRAPAFVAAIREIDGLSAEHWTFQARLAKPHVEQDRIVYTSASPFEAAESNAWWHCFDATQMLNRELRSVDAVLSETGRQRFSVRSVAGADTPSQFQRYIPTIDWEPVDLRVRVTDIPALVERLGGKQLYGDDPTVALRELVQNGIDAIEARRTLENRGADWGQVTVTLGADEGEEWLEVEDTGVGMSRAVLTGVLLDFGVSYWQTALAREEHPGLVVRGFEPIGHFGIGFFSVFMLGHRVRVSTRRPQDAMHGTSVLEFSRGLKARPVLRKPTPIEEMIEPGTRVRVWLRVASAERGGLLDAGDREWSLERLCAWLAPASSVNLVVRSNSKADVVVRANDWQSLPAAALIDRIWAKGVRAPFSPYDEVRDECAGHLRSLTGVDGEILGRAAVLPTTLKMDAWRSTTRTGYVTVGGLNAAGVQGIVGLLVGATTDAARRHAKPIADMPALALWASEQAELAARYPLSEAALESCAAIVRLFGGSCGSLPIARCADGWKSYADIAAMDLGDEVVLVSDSIVHLAESPHPPGSLVLASNVFAVNMGIPGIVVTDRWTGHDGQWPTRAQENSEDGYFWSQTLVGVVIDAVAVAWKVSTSSVLQSARWSRDEDILRSRAKLEDGEVARRPIGSLLGTLLRQPVHILVRPPV